MTERWARGPVGGPAQSIWGHTQPRIPSVCSDAPGFASVQVSLAVVTWAVGGMDVLKTSPASKANESQPRHL